MVVATCLCRSLPTRKSENTRFEHQLRRSFFRCATGGNENSSAQNDSRDSADYILAGKTCMCMQLQPYQDPAGGVPRGAKRLTGPNVWALVSRNVRRKTDSQSFERDYPSSARRGHRVREGECSATSTNILTFLKRSWEASCGSLFAAFDTLR
jgi:hypothetical protein